MSDPDLPRPAIEHEPEAPEARPPDKMAEPRERVVRRGGTPVLLTLVLFAALAGGLYWVWTNPMPKQAGAEGAEPSQTASQIAALSGQVQAAQQGQADLKQALESQIQALSARVEALEKAPPPAAPPPAAESGDEAKQIADLGTKLDALAAKEQSDAQAASQAAAQQQKPVEPPPASLPPEAAKQLSDLGSKLDELAAKEQSDAQAAAQGIQAATQAATQAAQAATQAAQQKPSTPDQAALDAVAAAAHSDAQGQIAALTQHTDESLAQTKSAVDQEAGQQKAALEQQAKADSAARDALAARVQKLEQGEGKVSGQAEKTAHAIRIEQAAVALQAGQPLGDIPDAPPALAAYATKAPPTEAALRGAFPHVADAIKAASRPEADKTSFLDRALARVQQSVTVRRGDHVIVGDPAAGIVARAQEDVANGDLAGAVHALADLQGPAAAAAADWVGQVSGLLAARSALASLSAHG